MRLLSPRRIRSWSNAASWIACVLLADFTLADRLGNSMAIAAPILEIAQSIQPASSCPQLTNRRYVVLLDRPANLLPQLPEFLAIAAIPCTYLNGSMTFFGGFDNAKASAFRATQLRDLGLDAIVHSFTAKVNDIPVNLQASAILIDPSNDPNAIIQKVRSLTGKSAVFGTFSNRSVILAAPLSSQQSANSNAVLLRNQGLAAQVIRADLIASPSAPNNSPDNSVPKTPIANPNNPSNPPTANNSKKTIYRVLVPNSNSNTLKLIRESAPDAFVTIFKGKSYIQVRTYTNRSNAHRERDRLNTQFSGTILIQD
jgi:hypothetical protein